MILSPQRIVPRPILQIVHHIAALCSAPGSRRQGYRTIDNNRHDRQFHTLAFYRTLTRLSSTMTAQVDARILTVRFYIPEWVDII
jgi:hypothetical protein